MDEKVNIEAIFEWGEVFPRIFPDIPDPRPGERVCRINWLPVGSVYQSVERPGEGWLAKSTFTGLINDKYGLYEDEARARRAVMEETIRVAGVLAPLMGVALKSRIANVERRLVDDLTNARDLLNDLLRVVNELRTDRKEMP